VTSPGRSAPVAARQPAREWTAAWLAAGGAVSGGLLFLVARTALTDDSYITFSYARNLALHGQWALVEGISANTATSPLNVWLLAALTFLLRAPVLAAGILLVATTAATALGLHALARDTGLNSWLVPGLGVAVLLTCPLLNSTVGLETYLAVALMVWLVRSALFGRWLGVGVLAGLLVLTRPDLVLLDVAVVALAAGWRRQLWRPLGALVLGAAVALPWHAFTWWRFGSATSDTLPAKSLAGGWGEWTYVDGLGHYLERWTLATSLTLPVLALGLVALVAWVGVAAWQRRLAPAGAAAIALAVGGLADSAGLSALQVAPFFWYYGPVLAGLGLCAVVTAAALVRRAPAPGRTAVAAVAAVVVLAGGYDVARGVPWEGMAPVRINWATPAEYQAIADGLPRGAVVESPGEVGTIAFFCNCPVVDYLADPGRMRPYVEEYRARHPGPPWSWNYARYDPPAPVPATWRVVYEPTAPDGPGQWPTTFPADRTKRMRLETK